MLFRSYQIDGGAPSTGNKVYNNTIINASDSRWCVNITELCAGNQVLNNILINQHPWHGSITCDASALGGFVSDYNLVVNSFSTDGGTAQTFTAWQGLGYDAHSQIAQSMATLFMDPLGDFRALNASSQQIDAGTSAVLPTVFEDLLMVARPQGAAYDIGCYEFEPSTGMADMSRPGSDLFIVDDVLHIPSAQLGDRVVISDLLGREVQHAVIRVLPATVMMDRGATGVMIVCLTDEHSGTRYGGKIIR